MSVDLSKLILNSNYNAFKNENAYYGSITFPATVPPATPSVPFMSTSVTLNLSETPVYTKFFAFFTELLDGLTGAVNNQWYPSSPNLSVAYYDPVAGVALPGFLLLSINNTTITVTANVGNQTATTYHVALTVPFVFIDYTLAN